jgi:TrmH family RNA methyltransferase
VARDERSQSALFMIKSSPMNDGIVFILVRPQFLGNLGSTARVLKNFGFDQLRLVAPPKNYKDAEARKMSVGAFDVLKHAQTFETLEAALSDVSLAIGTTSGKQREFAPQPFHEVLDALGEQVRANKCAIVFGDEVNGLARAELQRCHHVATISTNPDFPALNVAQAVGIIAYELSKLNPPQSEAITTFSTGTHDDAVFAQLDTLLDVSGFSRSFNRQKVLAELRSFYQRAHPTSREVELLTGALIRLNDKLNSDR